MADAVSFAKTAVSTANCVHLPPNGVALSVGRNRNRLQDFGSSVSPMLPLIPRRFRLKPSPLSPVSIGFISTPVGYRNYRLELSSAQQNCVSFGSNPAMDRRSRLELLVRPLVRLWLFPTDSSITSDHSIPSTSPSTISARSQLRLFALSTNWHSSI